MTSNHADKPQTFDMRVPDGYEVEVNGRIGTQKHHARVVSITTQADGTVIATCEMQDGATLRDIGIENDAAHVSVGPQVPKPERVKTGSVRELKRVDVRGFLAKQKEKQ